jgi:hypothetical protein
MWPFRGRRVLSISLLTALSACSPKLVRLTTPAVSGASFITLQSGWRLRVVTPILKSGGYQLHAAKPVEQGNTVTLEAGSDFTGYETAYYLVAPATGDRISLEFTSAEVTKDGKTSPQPNPLVPLFQDRKPIRYIRLVYLKRSSRSDHDMAVIGAQRPDLLESLTGEVENGGNENCRTEKRVFCSWIPAGIAVRPEILKHVDGEPRWVPAR